MRIWRIHIKNDIASGYTRQDLLNFCLREKLIGVGWNKINTRINSESEIRKQAKIYHPDETPAIKALNAMRSMEIGDLIWTRLNGIYYLCRVIGLWENSKPREIHYKLDISNYVTVEWLKIGMEQDVPGKVINSFRPAASAQTIRNVEDISMYMWNKYSKTKVYDIKLNNIDKWSVLSAEAIEELLLLYLQVEKGYFIYSSTVKYDFPTYECLLVNREGKHAYPQVKSGDDSLKADDYEAAFFYDENAEVYLFATSENYIQNNNPNVHFIYKPEMDEFIRKNRSLLPKMTQNWIDLCGEFYAS